LPSAPCGNAHAVLWETATALAAEPASTDMTRYTPERRVLPRYRVPDYEPYKQGLSPAGRADIDKWTAFPGWNYDPDMGEKVSPAQGEAWLAEEAHNLAVAVQAAADAAR